MKSQLSIRLSPEQAQQLRNFVHEKLRDMKGSQKPQVVLREAAHVRPPPGVDKLPVERTLAEIVITLLSGGGALAFFSVLKEWLRLRNTKVEIVDERNGRRIIFEGTPNEKNKRYVEELIATLTSEPSPSTNKNQDPQEE